MIPDGVPLDRLREVIARWFFLAQTIGRYGVTFETQFERGTARLSDLRPEVVAATSVSLSKTVDDTLTADSWTITLPNDSPPQRSSPQPCSPTSQL